MKAIPSKQKHLQECMFGRKRAKPEWTRLRNAVYVTYPYAKRAGYVFNDIERHIAKNPDKRVKKYINSREKELKKEFTDPLKNLICLPGKGFNEINQPGNRWYQLL